MLGNSNRHTILIISMCAHVRCKKKLYSLSRVPKQVHLSLMGEDRRDRANAEKHTSLQGKHVVVEMGVRASCRLASSTKNVISLSLQLDRQPMPSLG